MSDLSEVVTAAFARGGALARFDPNHVEREVQLRMALGVAQAIEERSALVAEAGTGVGKTFAYLVPTLLSGARALVSTATRACRISSSCATSRACAKRCSFPSASHC